MDTRSTGEVVASLIVNAQALLEKELELARLEVRQVVGRKLAALVMLLLAALTFTAVLVLAAVTVAIALEDVLAEPWMAWGLVTLVVTVVTLALLAVASRTLSRGWSLTVSRRSAMTTGAWLRDLGAELAGSPRSDDAPRPTAERDSTQRAAR